MFVSKRWEPWLGICIDLGSGGGGKETGMNGGEEISLKGVFTFPLPSF